METKEVESDPKMLEILLNGFPNDYKNAKGIPKAEFVEDVEEHLKVKKITGEEAKIFQQQQLDKYTMMENNLKSQRRNQLVRIPEIIRTADAIEFLKAKKEKEIKNMFCLSENVYAEAVMEKSGKAGIYVEHTYEGALKVLNDSLENAKKKVLVLNEDIAWIRDQLTTSEVNWSRFHNYNFMQRQKAKKK